MRPRTLIAGAVLLAVATAAGLLVRGTTVPFARGLIERTASESLGRTVTLARAPWVRLGSHTRLRVQGLHVANTAWAGPEPLLRLGEAQVSVDLASVFSGPILIEELVVDELHVRLARNAEGENNLPVLASAEDDAADDGREQRVILTTLRATNLSLHRDDEVTQQALRLLVDRLEQTSPAPQRLIVSGDGSLQGRPWYLEAEHSGLQSLIHGTGLEGSVKGELGDLRLSGAYRLADALKLEDLQGNVRLEGTVPPRIAELSPALDTDTPLLAMLVVEDVDPGISIDARVEAGPLTLTAGGIADDPADGDGVDLTFSLSTASLPRLATALGLGATQEVPLDVSATLRRDGRRVEVESLSVKAEDHLIEGRALFPEFPGTTDANLDLRLEGPDFALYQRLLQRPLRVEAPYSVVVRLEKGTDGRDAVRFDGTLGTVDVDIEGLLGEFPSYRNSELTVRAHSDALSGLGAAFDIPLPAVPFDLDGRLDISAQGVTRVRDFVARAAGAELRVDGRMDTYPELDDIDADLSLRTDALGETLRTLAYGDAGDVPAALDVHASGALRAIDLENIRLRAGASTLNSTAGALHVRPAGIESDLELEVTLKNAEELVTRAVPETLAGQTVSFSLSPRITPDSYAVALGNLDAAGASGSARLRLGRDLVLDEDALLEADLRFENPRQVLPRLDAYEPPSRPLGLTARTRGGSGEISAVLSSGDAELLRATISRGGEPGTFEAALSGSAGDLRALGTSPFLPEGALPYTIDARLSREQDSLRLALADLRLGATQASGSVQWNRAPRALTADIDIPRADLDPWFSREESPTGDVGAPAPAPARDRRVIPDTPVKPFLPEGFDIDVALRTGTLGITDPLAPGQQLVTGADLRLSRTGGASRLEIRNVSGSRGTLVGSLDLAVEAEGVAAAADLNLAGLPLGITSAGTSLAEMPQHDVTIDLQSRGATYRALAANLDGEFFLTGGRGVLQDMNLSFATESFIEQLLTALLPAERDEDRDMQVQCTVLAARATSGVVQLNPGFIMRSARVDLSARGNIDLNTERLAVRFDNQARKGLGISAASLVNPYVQISGTLARPMLGLDVAGSAIAGGAAFATGGLTVLAKPLFGRFLDRRNPCEVAIKRWEERKSG